MDVKTKFALGDTLCVITENAVKDFVAKAIVFTENGAEYGDSRYATYKEECCFSSRQELVEHLLGNTEKIDNLKKEEK